MTQRNHKATSRSERVDTFVELFSATQQKLYVYIAAMVFDSSDAYDVLQDTNLALWEKFDDFEPGTNFYAWAIEVARYRVLRYRQNKWARLRLCEHDILDELATQVADFAEESQDYRLDALRNCVQKLPEGDLQVVAHRYSSDGSVRRLSEQLGRTENAVSQSLRRIRRQLGECVQRQMSRWGESSS